MQWDRTTYVVSSKVFWGGKFPNQSGLCRKHVMEACHSALKRLQVEYLDLFFCHRPDPGTPIEETVYTMDTLIRQGKIFYWGTSEWSAQEIMQAYAVAKAHHLVPPVMEQPQYNLFHRYRFEVEYARLYSEIGMGTTIWSPLASGLLTGKYNEGLPKENTRAKLEGLEWLQKNLVGEEAKPKVEKVKKLARLAADLGYSLPQLAIAWCLKNPNVSTVILGASKTEQLKETLKSGEVVALLTPEVMTAIEEIVGNKPKVE
jgi:voltage-dependent potassium channel beta subunit